MTIVLNTPPAIQFQVKEALTFQNPFFYEYNGKIFNLALAREFYVDHIPLTPYFWPSVKIGSSCHHLSSAFNSEEEAMMFLRKLTEKIAQNSDRNRG